MNRAKPKFEAVCFDFDSTLSAVEGIDELAVRAGVGERIAPLTASAMAGEIALDAVYAARLDVVRPSRQDLAWLAARYIEAIVPGAKSTIDALRGEGVELYIVSGGLRPAIMPFAHLHGFAPDRVHAVDVTFRRDGSYEGFDRDSPLTRTSGKADVCRSLIKRHASLALVGDGITDLAAREAGAYVIGFGGVADRPAVRAGADRYAAGPGLDGVLQFLFDR